ncbi:MAG: hypothetical protein U5L01_18095 [Rheinheimera sp.]|nr:hypothetical protein [Rheinheimera sp.]
MLQVLVAEQVKVHLLISSAARVVFATEHQNEVGGTSPAMSGAIG